MASTYVVDYTATARVSKITAGATDPNGSSLNCINWNALMADMDTNDAAHTTARNNHIAAEATFHGIVIDGTPADNELVAWDDTAGGFINQTAAEAGLAASTHDHNGAGGAEVDHTDLGNIGTNTHAQVDTHIASTANPHSVTAAQAVALVDPGSQAEGDLFARGAATIERIPIGVDGQQIKSDGTDPVYEDDIDSVTFIFDQGGDVIAAGSILRHRFFADCTIIEVSLGADQSGSAVLDAWVDSHANYPPTVADTITAAAKPTLSAAIVSTDATLTGWSPNITAGDWLFVKVDSCATCTQLALCIKFKRT